jgi:hypothetical protein
VSTNEKSRPGERAASQRKSITTTEDTTAAAHRLSARGFHVFPVDHPAHAKCIGKHGANAPCDGHRGKHPAVSWGTWAATNTGSLINRAWRKWDGVVNIGIACGPSYLVVFDEDAAGELDRWCADHGFAPLPATYTVTTGRGRHLYYHHNHTERPIGLVPNAVKGYQIDVRGDGGYVVAAGSRHERGATYVGNDTHIVKLPTDVANYLLAFQKGTTDPAASEHIPAEDPGPYREHVGVIRHGDRDHGLVSYAGRLRATNLTYTEVLPVFRRRWLDCEQPEGQVPEAHYHGADVPDVYTWEQAQAKLRYVFDHYPAGAVPEAADAGEGDHEGLIQQRMTLLRVQREANRRLDAEERPALVLPPVKGLDVLLSEPDTPIRYRIDQLAPEGGRVLLSAQYKAGKTTVVGNLLRSLVDGEPFLGVFAVSQPVKRAVLIDTEMSEGTMRRWLRDQDITHTDAVADVITLRGNVSTFNLLDDACRQEWAARLRELGCDYLVLDCLRPVLDALGLDENRDAGRFLVAFDALLADAGIPNAVIVHHMGHVNERARGDSRLQDWPDAIWQIVRETEAPDSARYFKAYGRDVDVHEGRLDPSGRRLTYSRGSRQDAKTEAARGDIIGLLAKSDQGLGSNAIEDNPALAEHGRNSIRAGLKKAIEAGFVTVEDGPKRSKIHRINHPCEGCGMPVAGGGKRHQSCPE